MSVTGAIMAGIGAAGSIGGAAIASHGAGKAAQTQADASVQAAQINKEAQDAALAEERRQFDISQGNIAPWLSVGRSGLANLAYLMGILPTGTPASTAAATTAPQPALAGPATSGIAPAAYKPPGGFKAVYDLQNGFADNGGMQPVISDLGSYGPQSVMTEATPGAPGAAPSGTFDLSSLSSLINKDLGAPGSLLTPFTEKFTAPTAASVVNDPGYQFRLQQGEEAVKRSQAARGSLLSGGALKDLTDYAQGEASQEYGNAYNRAWNEFANRYNIFENNQTNAYNRLSALSGTGQLAASQLATLGTNNASNISNILLGGAAAQGGFLQNAAAARASGYVGGANAWSGALGGLGNNLANLYLLSKMFPKPSLGDIADQVGLR